MLDQIKDSQRFVVDVAQASEYYYWGGTLSENQSFFGPWIDTKGKALLAYEFCLLIGAPANGSGAICIATDSNGSNNTGRVSASVAPNGAAYGEFHSPAQFVQARFFAGATAGSYSYRIFLAIHPTS